MAKKTDTKIVSTPPTQSAALQAAGQMAALPTTGQGEFLLYQTHVIGQSSRRNVE